MGYFKICNKFLFVYILDCILYRFYAYVGKYILNTGNKNNYPSLANPAYASARKRIIIIYRTAGFPIRLPLRITHIFIT